MISQHTVCNKYIGEMKAGSGKHLYTTLRRLSVSTRRPAVRHACAACEPAEKRARGRVETAGGEGLAPADRNAEGASGWVNNTYVSAMAKCDQYNRDGP